MGGSSGPGCPTSSGQPVAPAAATRLVLAVAAVGAAVTVAGLILPSDAVAYREPAIHVAMEVSAGLIVLLVAYLAWGRFRSSGQLRDLALSFAAGVLGGVNLLYSAVPVMLGGGELGWLTWTKLASVLVTGTVFEIAAFASDRQVATVRRGAVQLMVGWAVAMGVIGLVGQLASAVPTVGRGGAAALLAAPALVLAAHATGTALLAAAAFGYWRRVLRTGDGMLAWLAAGLLLAAFARLNYLLLPGLFQSWLYTGDVLRLGFYLLLLMGAAREITAYWRAQAEVAVLDERRRLARDLHDGLTQELAYIAGQAQGLVTSREHLRASRVAAAAERALDESRRAIAALTRPVGEPLEAALVREAEEVAHRTGTSVRFALDSDLRLDQAFEEAALRITREGIANAGRHGRAREVVVEVRNGHGLLLRISDDGRGFDPSEVTGGGFGLISMRERAEALGGTFTVVSAPGQGATLEVLWPTP
jgi:signal transduction histidine kinase